MTISELPYALAIEPEHKTLSDVEGVLEPDLERALRAVLGPLVRIRGSRVYLIHQSAKEFLPSHPISCDLPFKFYSDATSETWAHVAIITFLNLAEFN